MYIVPFIMVFISFWLRISTSPKSCQICHGSKQTNALKASKISYNSITIICLFLGSLPIFFSFQIYSYFWIFYTVVVIVYIQLCSTFHLTCYVFFHIIGVIIFILFNDCLTFHLVESVSFLWAFWLFPDFQWEISYKY
jgi:hypothetical protein